MNRWITIATKARGGWWVQKRNCPMTILEARARVSLGTHLMAQRRVKDGFELLIKECEAPKDQRLGYFLPVHDARKILKEAA